MTSLQSTDTPLGRLVLFMVCLSIAGSLVAGAHYFAVDLPAQKAITAPANDYCEMSCEDVYNEYKDNGYPEWACLNYRYYCLKDCRGY
ncbi:MAG: hypothetical protein ACYDDV_10755 [Methanoregula sp.]